MTAALTTAPGESRSGRPARRHPGAVVLVFVGAGIVAAASVAVIAHLGVGSLGYAAASSRVALIVLTGGCGLVAVGIARRLQDPLGTVGPLAALLGICWLSTSWVAWVGGPSVVRSAAMLSAPLVLPLVLHLGLVAPRRGLEGRARTMVVVGYLMTAVVTVGRLLVLDPFRDRYCWDDCAANALVVHDAPEVARKLQVGWWWLSILIGTVVVIVAVGRASTASRATLRQLLPLTVPIATIGGVAAIHGALRLADPAERPTTALSTGVFTVTALAFLAVALAVGWMVADDLQARRAVRRLAEDLASTRAAGTLQQVLARTLGDRDLRVAYHRSDRHTLVDADGQPIEVRPSSTRVEVPIERDGECVAIVFVDRSASRTHDLGREIGSAARLAVDNERLRAEALAQLGELRSSRLRIVETADLTRRRLERDLHDGVQQRLLALTYQVRLAIDDAQDDGDVELQSILDTAAKLVDLAFGALRELAHGLHPVILSEAGLGPALNTLADTAPMRMTVSGVPADRLPERIERAAYLTIVHCAESAARRGASSLQVRFSVAGDRIAIEIGDDGDAQEVGDLGYVVDRLSAIGGSLVIDTDRTQAVIPCG